MSVCRRTASAAAEEEEEEEEEGEEEEGEKEALFANSFVSLASRRGGNDRV